ncbi:tRNA dimethylallyltransferase 2-like isoform X2 [Euphorbia lathyris]|uniref:tRNA dimethylallyltransferase 2-like isoform X2 n=1 Tax=Euphorbia lathyris TaxID=212925 RepID=UPI003313F107
MESEDGDSQSTLQNPSDGGRRRMPTTSKEGEQEAKPKVVVIMGPTGSGKSKLAIDLASHFPIEIINADSMQVYHGLDVLTNKVPLHEQNGVPHHLLGTISPNVEFTAKDFRDCAIPALVSPFLLDDTTESLDESPMDEHLGDEQNDLTLEFGRNDFNKYHYLKELDPVAANRVHPHDNRKINQYLNLYARSGILPSKLYQGKAAENWGRIDNCRFDYCFICVDAAIPVLDQFVGQRVDSMINAGLLSEVYEIFKPHAVYTRGLRQAIGVREFEGFLRLYLLQSRIDKANECCEMVSAKNGEMLKDNAREILFSSSDDNELKNVLAEAIEKVKLNTRRLVRRQKRRLSRLRTLFGWNIQYVDSTESISSKSNESWAAQVVGPAVEIITSFLRADSSSVCDGVGNKLMERNLWTQYVCKACSDRVLRGAHEWEQHKLGRSHRKRLSSIRKSQGANRSAVSND